MSTREMKDSGIEWIGQIPKGWEVCRLRQGANLILGKMLESKKPHNTLEDYSLEYYLKSKNIGALKLYNDINNVEQMWFNEKERHIYLLKEGDIVMNEGGDIGKVALWKDVGYDCYIQNSVHKITPISSKMTSSFLLYVLFSVNLTGYFKSIVNTISIAHLTKEKLSQTPILIPPLYEQRRIATFLDEKCKDIDTLITLQEEMIAELQAYKQSVISETVTKGLNPNVPMKDSGVEWIGEIPEHWEICRLKNIFNLKTGTTPKEYESKSINEEYINWFTPSDISDFNTILIDSQRKLAKETIIKEGINLYPAKSLLFVGIGATAGKIGYSEVQGYSNQQITALIPQKGFSKFYFYLLLTYKDVIRDNAFYTTLPIINNSYLSKVKTIIPPFSEQQAIADYLDTKCSQIDELIALKQQKITELQDYKKSLIYEYVTGKKEVPDNN